MASDRIDALHGQLESGVSELVNSDKWQAWLKVAAKFHKYSFNNQLLILLQTEGKATHVAGYRKWQELNRQVIKGSKSIGILAPSTRKEIDPATGEESRKIVGYRVVSVFDISQTEGEPLPEETRPELLDGDAPEFLQSALVDYIARNGFTFERGDTGTANGYTVPSTKTIRVRENCSDAQLAKTTIHEIAHMLLHVEDDNLIDGMHRGVMEVEAESVAFIVANYYGIVSAPYSLPYVAGWSDGKSEVISATAARVTKTSRKIIDAVQDHLAASAA